MTALAKIISGLIGRRPPHLQVAALCVRKCEGGTQVLLVSSRGTGRWIVPKGWPMRGRSLAEAAEQEAWEEAGVTGKISREPCGRYHYDKGLDEGGSLRVSVLVFKLKTQGLADDYPEAQERKRSWFTPKEAAELVEEPELKDILRAL